MPIIRRARARRSSSSSPGKVSSFVAASALVPLVLGLLATPMGAAAATPAPTPTPTASASGTPQSAPDESPAPEPTTDESPAPTPGDTPAPEPGATAATPEPSPAPVESDADADAGGDAPRADDEPAPDAEGHAADPPAPVAPDDDVGPQDSETTTEPAAPHRMRIGIMAAGVPDPPTPVWSETFEQGLSLTTPSALTAYASGRFTASSGWTVGTNCTGVLVNYTATYPNSSFCPPQTNPASSLSAREARRLADVLGQVGAGITGSSTASTPANGSTTGAAGSQSNHALVGIPTATVTGGTTVAQTTAGIGVSAPGARYYTLRFDAAGAPCGAANASLALSLFSGSTTLLAAFPTPVVPCTTTGSVFYTSPVLPANAGGSDPAWGVSVRAATFTGTAAALLSPAQISSAQVRLTNTATGTGSGFAVDNVRVMDATPTLDTSFTPSPAIATTPTTLTYTVTNSSDLLAKTDWGFTTTLPTGLAVATAPTIGGTCANVAGAAYAVTAAAGSSTIAVTGGDLAAGTSSCTITVNVVAPSAGTTSSGTTNGTGLIVSAPTTLTVNPATTLTVRKNIVARTAPADQFTVSVRSGTTVLASATTAGTATGVQPQQVSNLTVTSGASYTIHETITAGAGLTYASSYECVRDGTVIAVGSSPSGTLTMPADQGAQVVCTFTNTPQTARLSCTTNQFYALSGAGELVQTDIVTGANATVGTWNVGTNANALGIATNGSVAYALQRSTDAANVVSMLKWTPSNGFQTLANSAYTTAGPGGSAVTGSLVAGAVDLSGSRFVFGKFSGSSFHLWSFTESNPAASRYAYLGSFATAGAPNGNGDLAFDARGNLYVVGAATVGSTASAVIFTVTAENLAGANGGVLPVSTTTAKGLSGTDASPAFTNVNGLAFSPRGTAYISDAATAYEFDPTTWTRIPGSARSLDEHTDLASCSSPSTVTVLKNAVGRAAAADQFTLTLANGATTVATATTTGTATGRQAQQIGPVPAVVGSTLTLSEAMAAGSASAITVYTTIYECWADGIRLSNGTTPSGSVTVPNRPGVNVVCTYFNSPRPASTVAITTQILNPSTGATTPATGWSASTTATATAGTAMVLPSEAPRQLTNAQGTANWTVLYGSTASRASLVVSEEIPSGFLFASASCTVGGAAVPVSFTQSSNIVSGTIAGTQSASTIACTFVNRPVAVLTLVKRVSFGSAVPSDWVLTGTGPAGALPGPSGRGGTGGVSAVNVSPGVPYRLAEAGGPLTYAQVGAWSCVTSTGAAVAVSAASDVTLAQGSNVTCTVTNATSRVTLLKEVEGAQAGFRPAD